MSKKKPLHELTKKRYLNYAMSVITSRALPDVRDGLKPVHRRILYTMHQDLRLTSSKKHRKSAAVVGRVLGAYHPHGDQSVYNAMVRMAQDWAMRMPLVDGHGNFGSIDGDNPAAHRYCVTGNTRVPTSKGTLKIKDIIPDSRSNHEYDINCTLYGKNGEKVKASKLFNCGEHPTLALQTNGGLEITGTGNHPLLTIKENEQGKPILSWKLLEDMEEGDYVAIARKLFSDDLETTSEGKKTAFLLGAMVAEGWCQNNRSGFNNTDRDYFDYVVACWKEVVGDNFYVSSRELPSGKTCYEIDVHNLEQVKKSRLSEIYGLNSYHKKIPEFIWRSSKEEKRIFLQSLFEGDGSFVSAPRNSVNLSYSTFSEKLADDIQKLLLEFGIYIKKYKEGMEKEIKLQLTNRHEVKKFASSVGFWGIKQEKLTSSLNKLRGKCGLSLDKIPYISKYVRDRENSCWLKKNNFDRYARFHLKKKEIIGQITSEETQNLLEKLVSKGYYYDQVSSVKKAGNQKVYSVRIDTEDHAFLANGFVNHNTEAKLRPVMSDLMVDIKNNTVSFRSNYDNTTEEPEVLPFPLPMLLINGSTGIAVGMATNIPPHNVGNVCDAAIDLLRNPNRKAKTLVRNNLIGPDFPTGGSILESPEEMEKIYTDGKGTVTIRSKWHTEKRGRGKGKAIVITEIPYGVAKQKLVEKVAHHIVDGDLPQVSDIRDESTTDIRVVLELKRGANVEAVMAYLLKYTPLQEAFHVNLTCLVPEDGRVVPKRLDVKKILQYFLKFRFRVISKRLKYELKGLEERIHILKGFVTVLADAQTAVDLVMESKSKEESRTKLMSEFSIDEDQANHVLDTKIYRLAAYETKNVHDELKEKEKRAKEIRGLLADKEELKDILISELKEMKKKYDDGRRSIINEDLKSFKYDESLYIEEEDVYCVVTRNGWIKRQKSYTDLSTLRVKDSDELGWVLPANTRDVILFFTNKGKVYTERVDELPDTTGYGEAIQGMFSFANGEKVVACFTNNKNVLTGNEELLSVSERGRILRFDASDFLEPSSVSGRRYMKTAKDGGVVNVLPEEKGDHAVIISEGGRCIAFDPSDVRKVKNAGKGVKGIVLGSNDSVLAFGLTNGTRGGSLSVITNKDSEHDIRHTTIGVGERGRLGNERLKRGTFVKWNREVVEIE